ncbi:MAG TPA: trypsin-like peptidase domain-containing protein [Bacteroidota bacterium]|nr:trypsin-like peptidase domain-containing protein [Bacteroidota bacterium]
MNNPYVRFFILLSVPLVIGIVIGYAVKPTAQEANAEPATSALNVNQQSSDQNAAAKQDQESSSRQNAITRAVAKASPAVVGINVTEVRQFRDPMFPFFGDDPFFRQFFGDRTYRQKVQNLGSGFIISTDGYIVTNDHVAGNAAEITVTMVGGKRLNAKLVGTDPLTDVALLKVQADGLPWVQLGSSDDIIIGEWAIAMGNPFGLFEINDKPTITVGVISSLGMSLGSIGNHFYRDMIETDAAINGGNSGGPLVNSLGEVIGMNTLIYTGGQTSTYIGYGFAIPVNKVKKVVAELKKKGSVAHDVATGFDAQPVDERIAQYFGLARAQGIIVSEVESGGPAEKAGLKVGDIIVETNGERVSTEEDFLGIVADASPGDVLKLKVYREKKMVELNLKLEKSS